MVSTISLLYCRHESRMVSSNAVIICVNNFVSNYSRILLHMSLNLPSNISASVVHNIVRNSLKAFVEH